MSVCCWTPEVAMHMRNGVLGRTKFGSNISNHSWDNEESWVTFVAQQLFRPAALRSVPAPHYGNSGPSTKTAWGPIRLIINFRGKPICQLEISDFNFTPVWLQNACSSPQNWVWGLWPLKVEKCQRDPRRHILSKFCVVWVIKRENPSTGLTCRWVPYKKA